MGCYELSRYGNDRDKMIENLMTIYATHATLNLPPPGMAELPPTPEEMRAEPSTGPVETKLPRAEPVRPLNILSS
jgi:hypothetical protein